MGHKSPSLNPINSGRTQDARTEFPFSVGIARQLLESPPSPFLQAPLSHAVALQASSKRRKLYCLRTGFFRVRNHPFVLSEYASLQAAPAAGRVDSSPGDLTCAASCCRFLLSLHIALPPRI